MCAAEMGKLVIVDGKMDEAKSRTILEENLLVCRRSEPGEVHLTVEQRAETSNQIFCFRSNHVAEVFL